MVLSVRTDSTEIQTGIGLEARILERERFAGRHTPLIVCTFLGL
jgi:hypothetical protein